MASNDFTLNTKEFKARMNIYDKRSHAAAVKGMDQNTKDLEKLAKQLAPKAEGTLEGDILARRVTTRVGKDIVGETHAGTGQSRAYALKVHEGMAPAIAAQFGPGPTTRSKPGNEFGEAGGKFLTRPLLGKSEKYMKHIADKIKAVK